MGNAFIAIGVFTWFIFIMITYVFLTPPSTRTIIRVSQSFKIRLSKSTGLEFGVSVLKLTGILWIAVGIFLKFMGEALLQEIVGDVIIGVVILTPVWVGAFFAEWKKDKGF